MSHTHAEYVQDGEFCVVESLPERGYAGDYDDTCAHVKTGCDEFGQYIEEGINRGLHCIENCPERVREQYGEKFAYVTLSGEQLLDLGYDVVAECANVLYFIDHELGRDLRDPCYKTRQRPNTR